MTTCATLKVRTEHEEQREFVSWFRQTYEGVKIFAIPNGGHRGKREALRLRVEGVTRGVPDLFIPAWWCWVEMKKVEGGYLSKDQKEMKEYLEVCGHKVIVGHGFEDAKNQILELREQYQQ